MKVVKIEMRTEDLDTVVTVLKEDVNSIVSADDRLRIARILEAYKKSKQFGQEENWK